MFPLTYAGAGWCLVALGLSGPFGAFVGMVGLAVTIVGVGRVRWRNDLLSWTWWAAIALLGLLVVFVVGVQATFVVALLLSALQAGIGIGLALGVRACLRGAAKGAPEPVVERLRLVAVLIGIAFVLTALANLTRAAGLAVPNASLIVVFLVQLAVNLWLGVMLLQLREHPAVQETATRR